MPVNRTAIPPAKAKRTAAAKAAPPSTSPALPASPAGPPPAPVKRKRAKTTHPRTQAQIEASRKNGALSKGPVTFIGKMKSSRNGVTHGLYSKYDISVMQGEDPEAFQSDFSDYLNSYQPGDRPEFDFVWDMAGLRWFQTRLRAISTRTLERIALEAGPNDDPIDALAVGFAKDPKALARILSFEKAAGALIHNRAALQKALIQKSQARPAMEPLAKISGSEPNKDFQVIEKKSVNSTEKSGVESEPSKAA